MAQNSENKTLLEKKGSGAYVVFLSCFAGIGGFLLHYNLGIISGAILLIKDYFRLDTVWMELLMSAPIASATIFSLIAGTIADKIGRRKVIMISSFAFSAGAIVLAIANGKEMFLFGGITVGIGIGKYLLSFAGFWIFCNFCYQMP